MQSSLSFARVRFLAAVCVLQFIAVISLASPAQTDTAAQCLECHSKVSGAEITCVACHGDQHTSAGDVSKGEDPDARNMRAGRRRPLQRWRPAQASELCVSVPELADVPRRT